jgi:hypothetical protein
MPSSYDRSSGRSFEPTHERTRDRRYDRHVERQYDLDPEYERELIRQTAATRRAIVLGVLTLAVLLSLILAFLSVVPKWLPVLALIPLGAFIVAAIMTAGARREAREYARADTRDYARDARDSSMYDVEEPLEQSAAVDDWDSWDAWDDADSWTAVPTTLPTYVSAPRASAVPRRIDRSRPGEWTGSAMVETAQAMRRNVDELHAADPPSAFDDALTAEIPAVRHNRVASA